MIDFSGRVLAVNIEPSEPMGVMRHPVNMDFPVAVAVPSARFCAHGNAPPLYAPIKKPRFGAVVEQLPEPLRREAELKFAGHEGFSKKKAPGSRKAPGAI